MEPDKPVLVLVTGRSGAGKSTLAPKLAMALSCPLVSRDQIYEGIRLTFGHGPQAAADDRIVKAAFDAFFGTIELLVRAGVTLVAEAAFQDPRWRIGLGPITALADIRIVRCVLEPELAAARVARRRTAARRQGNPPNNAPFVPVSLPVPTLPVDTGDGYAPGFDEIVAFARAGATADQ
jgi:predicted kinase